MPTNRTRIKRAARSRVTDEARAIFNDAVELQAIYHGCSRTDGNCRSTAVNRHCADCVRYIDLSQKLGSLLGIKPWETSPLNANSETPPDYLRHNPLQFGYWRKAWAIRRELEA